MGLKEALEKAGDVGSRPVEIVPVPELGEGITLTVRGMTGTQRDAYEKSIRIIRKGQAQIADDVRAKLLVRCILAEDGTGLMFTEHPKDIATVGNLPAKMAERLFDACRRVCGMTDEEQEKKDEPSA